MYFILSLFVYILYSTAVIWRINFIISCLYLVLRPSVQFGDRG